MDQKGCLAKVMIGVSDLVKMAMSGTDVVDQAIFGSKVIDMPFGTGIPASKMDREFHFSP